MATSTSSHSLVKTERTFPPASTRSAGSSPLATAIQCASMTVNNTLIPALPIPYADSLFDERRLPPDAATRSQCGTKQDEDEPDAHAGGEFLVQDEDPRKRGHRRVDVRDHGGAHRSDRGDQREEDDERQRGTDKSEHAHGYDHSGARNGPRQLKGRQRRVHDRADREGSGDHAHRWEP